MFLVNISKPHNQVYMIFSNNRAFYYEFIIYNSNETQSVFSSLGEILYITKQYDSHAMPGTISSKKIIEAKNISELIAKIKHEFEIIKVKKCF